MFIEKIIPKALAQEPTSVIEKLDASDVKLEELNNELLKLTTEYGQVNTAPAYYSFFNMDNIYFWFTLGGLLLLAVGLLFLLIELKKYQPKKVIKFKEAKPSKPIKEKVMENKIEHKNLEDIKTKEKETSKPEKKKAVKIKVIKVK